MSQDTQLAQRLAFMRMDASERAVLAGLQPQIDAALPGALDAFYAQIRTAPEVMRLFSGEAHIAGAKSAQQRHWQHLASGAFDQAYAESVQRIGGVHARIGLEPRWYVGGYALVLTGLLTDIIRGSARKGLFAKSDPDALAKQVSAVVKAALIDMEISISIYLEASETARREVEAAQAAAQAEQARVVEATAKGLSSLAAGDLTAQIREAFPADYEKLRGDFNAALDRLHETVEGIVSNANGMATGIGQVSQAADDLSRRTEQQAASLEETAAALDEITATVQRTSEAATSATQLVLSARDEAANSGEVVGAAVTAMSGIEQSSKEIGQIIGVIDEIAFQTNLLALNAGVEAARAGDAGRGFAVVASEVRALAQRSAQAAKEIKTLISTSSHEVGKGVDLVRRTGEALERISGQVQQITGVITEIAGSAKEQAVGLHEVNTAINQMDQVTQQNAAMVEESSAATQTLAGEARELLRLMASFHLNETSASAPTARQAAPAKPRVLQLISKAQQDDWKEF